MLALLSLLLVLGLPQGQESAPVRPQAVPSEPVAEVAQVARWTRSLSLELSLRPHQQFELRRILEDELTLRAARGSKGSRMKGKAPGTARGAVPPARPARPRRASAPGLSRSEPPRPRGVDALDTTTLSRILALLDARQSRRYVELVGPQAMVRLRALGQRRSAAWSKVPQAGPGAGAGGAKGAPKPGGKGRGRGGRRRLF